MARKGKTEVVRVIFRADWYNTNLMPLINNITEMKFVTFYQLSCIGFH